MVRKTLQTVGGIFLAALAIAALAPKAARGVAAALVQVTNPTTSPVPILDVNNSGEEPARFAGLCIAEGPSVDSGVCGSNSSVIVVPKTTPDGLTVKRFVLEFVSGTCILDSVQVTSVGISASNAVIGETVANFPASPGVGGPLPVSAYAQSLRLYFDPGDVISVGAAFTPSTGEVICQSTASGYYVTQ